MDHGVGVSRKQLSITFNIGKVGSITTFTSIVSSTNIVSLKSDVVMLASITTS